LTFAALMLLPLTVHAEGEDPDAPAKPKPAAHHKAVKKKAAPAPVAPSGPIPYTVLNPAAAVTPVPPAPQIAPQGPATMPSPALTVPPPPPPPPPPAAMLSPSAPQTAPQVGVRSEINLKCDTVTSANAIGKTPRKDLTRGSFYIDLFPSDVFPDQQADFKFSQVDPQHASLVRESDCLDTLCDARVSGSAYFLVNRVTRKGAALRITLNRANGAFYAESIDPKALIHPGQHIGESGYCVPQKLSGALF
jgi:hypothetical protein